MTIFSPKNYTLYTALSFYESATLSTAYATLPNVIKETV